MMTENSKLTPLMSEYADDPEMSDLVELFVEELPDRIQALQESFEKSQFDQLRHLAHQIKGAGGGYGYPILSTVAGELEHQLNDSGDDAVHQIEQSFRELVELCQRATLAA